MSYLYLAVVERTKAFPCTRHIFYSWPQVGRKDCDTVRPLTIPSCRYPLTQALKEPLHSAKLFLHIRFLLHDSKVFLICKYTQTKKCSTFMLLSIFLKWFCQMLFGQYGVKLLHNILRILIFLRYYEKIWLYAAQKASGKAIWEICLVA